MNAGVEALTSCPGTRVLVKLRCVGQMSVLLAVVAAPTYIPASAAQGSLPLNPLGGFTMHTRP